MDIVEGLLLDDTMLRIDAWKKILDYLNQSTFTQNLRHPPPLNWENNGKKIYVPHINYSDLNNLSDRVKVQKK